MILDGSGAGVPPDVLAAFERLCREKIGKPRLKNVSLVFSDSLNCLAVRALVWSEGEEGTEGTLAVASVEYLEKVHRQITEGTA